MTDTITSPIASLEELQSQSRDKIYDILNRVGSEFSRRERPSGYEFYNEGETKPIRNLQHLVAIADERRNNPNVKACIDQYFDTIGIKNYSEKINRYLNGNQGPSNQIEIVSAEQVPSINLRNISNLIFAEFYRNENVNISLADYAFLEDSFTDSYYKRSTLRPTLFGTEKVSVKGRTEKITKVMQEKRMTFGSITGSRGIRLNEININVESPDIKGGAAAIYNMIFPANTKQTFNLFPDVSLDKSYVPVTDTEKRKTGLMRINNLHDEEVRDLFSSQTDGTNDWYSEISERVRGELISEKKKRMNNVDSSNEINIPEDEMKRVLLKEVFARNPNLPLHDLHMILRSSIFGKYKESIIEKDMSGFLNECLSDYITNNEQFDENETCWITAIDDDTLISDNNYNWVGFYALEEGTQVKEIQVPLSWVKQNSRDYPGLLKNVRPDSEFYYKTIYPGMLLSGDRILIESLDDCPQDELLQEGIANLYNNTGLRALVVKMPLLENFIEGVPIDYADWPASIVEKPWEFPSLVRKILKDLKAAGFDKDTDVYYVHRQIQEKIIAYSYGMYSVLEE